MTSMLRWDDCDTYEPGFHIGSEANDGSHLRWAGGGWPYSIYRKAVAPGYSDQVICNGIQVYDDAKQILDRINCLA